MNTLGTISDTSTCQRFEQEGLLRVERGLPLDAHFDTCPACRAARLHDCIVVASLKEAPAGHLRQQLYVSTTA